MSILGATDGHAHHNVVHCPLNPQKARRRGKESPDHKIRVSDQHSGQTSRFLSVFVENRVAIRELRDKLISKISADAFRDVNGHDCGHTMLRQHR